MNAKFRGFVASIHVAREHGDLPRRVERAEAVVDRGLVGDRQFGRVRRGVPQTHRALTLIEAEALEALARDAGIELEDGAHRRNVVTRGVPLNHLVGRRFRVGEVLCEGTELCESCHHLQKMTQPGVLKGLLHRGGLCARILEGGQIRPGDPVTPV